jgi:pimeloyl-ACP methyl ester carboxylesterase
MNPLIRWLGVLFSVLVLGFSFSAVAQQKKPPNILIIWGDDDQLLPAAYGPAYRDLIPSSSLHIIAQCGHLPHVEKAQEFVAKVTQFTKEVA